MNHILVKMINKIYDYSYGDECILGSHIIIYKKKHDIYIITFTQSSFFPKKFRDMCSTHKILDKNVMHKKEIYGSTEDDYIDVREIKMTIKAHCNPAPETLFYVV